MIRLLAINGSYRTGGVIDQAVEVVVSVAAEADIDTEIVLLRDYPIEFCRNCRQCTQTPGDQPGQCQHQDGMRDLIAKIEAADALVFASPTNFSSVTAVFKRFMERLAVYGYWPWGMPAPELRRKTPTKKAILIASSAAPGILGRWAFSTLGQLRMTAKLVGARTVASIFIGKMSLTADPGLPEPVVRKLQRATYRLIAGPL
jgi:NAD(P)H-dependent FMN reductase